ncbi:MAG: nuclear transport factor 2 family protein, partial [Sphingomonadales bacterium]
VIGFTLAMDARDAARYRLAWADEIELDLPPLGGLPLSGQRRADDYTRDAIALVSEFEATQHVSGNHLISVDGDRGRCICYILATHYLPLEDADPWLKVGVRYDLGARRFDEIGWRFNSFRLTALWSKGNGGLWKIVGRRLAQRRANI